MSLARRLRQPRTIISIVLPLAAARALRAEPARRSSSSELPDKILAANPWLLLAAFAIFYLGFPFRGLRWAMLVRAHRFPLTVSDATEIIFLSWLVNCLVPAKLGDVYRAYLLKINSPVSLSRTFGTVFIERILDLFAIVVLGLAAGFWLVPRAACRATSRSCSRSASSWWSCARRWPAHAAQLRAADHHQPAAAARGPRVLRPVRGGRLRRRSACRALPRLIIITGLIWATEAMRLYLVVEALGLPGVHLGISGAFFVALSARSSPPCRSRRPGIGCRRGRRRRPPDLVYGVRRPRRSRSRSSIGRSACSRSSSSARSRT